MSRRRGRQQVGDGDSIPSKRRKLENQDDDIPGAAAADAPVTARTMERPKSRKELRMEKKAALKAASSLSDVEEETKMEQIRLKKERRKEARKELERLLWKERRKEKKIRNKKNLHRKMNAPGGAKNSVKEGKKKKKSSKAKKESSATTEEQTADLALFQKAYHGNVTDADASAEGTATLRLGVKVKDLVLGKGPMVRDRMLVTVKYTLTGGKFGATIDSSKNFNFRLGKGEVIQGWEIGMAGMRQGGRRKLIIPPKAGYGSQDIGAGPGALLFFDISLLACRV